MKHSKPNIFFDETFILDCQRYCVIGKKIILASAIFETGLSKLLHAEGEAIDKISNALPEGFCVKLDDLEDYNKITRELVCCIAEIKEKMLHEMKLGKEIVDKECDLCDCEC